MTLKFVLQDSEGNKNTADTGKSAFSNKEQIINDTRCSKTSIYRTILSTVVH